MFMQSLIGRPAASHHLRDLAGRRAALPLRVWKACGVIPPQERNDLLFSRIIGFLGLWRVQFALFLGGVNLFRMISRLRHHIVITPSSLYCSPLIIHYGPAQMAPLRWSRSDGPAQMAPLRWPRSVKINRCVELARVMGNYIR